MALKGKLPGVLFYLEALLQLEVFLIILVGFDLPEFYRIFLPMAGHMVTVLLMGVGFAYRWDYRVGRDKAWAVLGMSITLALPLLGFISYVFLYWMLRDRNVKRDHGELLKDFQEYISYDAALNDGETSKIDSDQFILDEVDVSPIKELLTGADHALKRGAILSLSRVATSESVALLKGCLADESREIRYYASTALSEMEKSFNDRIFRLVKEVERNPTRTERHIELARSVVEYVDSGLLDPGMVRYFYDIGLRALDKAGMVPGHSGSVEYFSGLILGRKGDRRAAIKMLAKAIELMPADIDARLLMAQLQFEIGALEDASKTLSEAGKAFPMEARIADVAAVIGI